MGGGAGLGGKDARWKRERRSCEEVPTPGLREKRSRLPRVEQRGHDLRDLDRVLDAVGRDRTPPCVRHDDQKVAPPVAIEIGRDDHRGGAGQVELDPPEGEIARARAIGLKRREHSGAHRGDA